VDQAIHCAEQRRSWVRGMCSTDPGPDLLVEEIQRLRAEYERVPEDYVVVNERHADIALGLLEVPQHERGGCWHIETEGVLRALVLAAAVKASDALEGSNGT
jgi:hypothetical protein